jgi:type II secretion system protein J
MRPRGFTLVELIVAIAVGVVLLYAAYQAIGGLARSEKVLDRKASRAIVMARLMEYLMADLRSAVAVTPQGQGQYSIERSVFDGSQLSRRAVVWRQQSETLIIRQPAWGNSQQFNFQGLLDPDVPALRFRLERVPDVLFVP